MANQKQQEHHYPASGMPRRMEPAANDAGSADAYEQNAGPLADATVQLPLVQQMYRAVKNWQEEFAPRSYRHEEVPANQPRPRNSA